MLPGNLNLIRCICYRRGNSVNMICILNDMASMLRWEFDSSPIFFPPGSIVLAFDTGGSWILRVAVCGG